MLVLTLSASLALADDPELPDGFPELDPASAGAPEVDWDETALRYRRRMRTAHIGFAATIAAPLMVGAAFWPLAETRASDPLIVAGAGLMLIGPPILFAGALSSQQLLRRAGLRVPAVAGLVGVAAWAAPWVGLFSQIGIIDGGPRPWLNPLIVTGLIATPVLGGLQLYANGRSGRGHDLHLMPSTVRGGAGLTLVVQL